TRCAQLRRLRAPGRHVDAVTEPRRVRVAGRPRVDERAAAAVVETQEFAAGPRKAKAADAIWPDRGHRIGGAIDVRRARGEEVAHLHEAGAAWTGVFVRR